MASETGSPFERVNWLAALVEAPFAVDFHQAMRRIEHAFPELPRWGEAARPKDEPIRLAQDPSLAFAPAAMATFTAPKDGALGRLAVAFMGLFGPNGPLPLHITDYVRERVRNAGDETFVAFTDLFHHRALILFHRAWSQGRPAVSRDRRRADRFLTYVGAICGLGLQAFLARDPSLHLASLHFAGLLAADSKNPDGLRAVLQGYFQLPVRIREFMGEWLPIPAEARFRLGFSRDVSALGRTAVLGTRSFSRSQKFRVVLGPLSERDFTRFLPHGASLERLTTLVRAYAGIDLAWDLELVPAAGSATQLRLGHAGRLGFNAVLGDVPKPVGRAHVIVDPFSHQTERTMA